jgi:hypothetical protein
MKNPKRILAILLILLALVLALTQLIRLSSNTDDESAATAALLASTLRQTMRSPVDSLMIELDQYLASRVDEMKIFEPLKAAKDAGKVHAAFVESSARTLMDPYDRETIPESPLGSGMLTLSTGNAELPAQDELDAISAFEQEKVRQGERPSKIQRYMKGEKESPVIWLVRAFTTPGDTTVKELGVGFLPVPGVDPYIARILNEIFPKDPVWQKAGTSGAPVFALELINSNGEIMYAIGDKTGKAPTLQQKLDRNDLAYTGWTIQVWSPKQSSVWPMLILAAILLLVGLVLVFK